MYLTMYNGNYEFVNGLLVTELYSNNSLRKSIVQKSVHLGCLSSGNEVL